MAAETESLEETIKTILLQNEPERTIPNDQFIIHGISGFIKDNRNNPFAPKKVTIGPIYHGEGCCSSMEDKKRRFLYDFLTHDPQVNSNAYAEAIRSAMVGARRYYIEPIRLTGGKFAQMLLLDGCFILELVLKLGTFDGHSFLCSARWEFMTILSDLLLIENQIPFFVLEELFAVYKDLDGHKSPVDSDLKSLVGQNLFAKCFGLSVPSNRVQGLLDGPVHHLLHLYHQLSLPNPEKVCCTARPHLARSQKHYRLRRKIPSASQLLEFGFVLRKQDPINKCDVTLEHSVIKIPRLIIDSSSQTLLMNLLALEHELEETKRIWTGLTVMMNCLVKNKSDLEILQRSRIILNLLPSEKKLIQFFSLLNKRFACDVNAHYFSDLFDRINISCDSYFRQKRAWMMHDYFKNPWAAISFSSSIAAILLSTVQTLVSVHTYRRSFH